MRWSFCANPDRRSSPPSVRAEDAPPLLLRELRGYGCGRSPTHARQKVKVVMMMGPGRERVKETRGSWLCSARSCTCPWPASRESGRVVPGRNSNEDENAEQKVRAKERSAAAEQQTQKEKRKRERTENQGRPGERRRKQGRARARDRGGEGTERYVRTRNTRAASPHTGRPPPSVFKI